MAIDRTRYRQLDFIGARILQARELNWLQEMAQGFAVSDNETPVSGMLGSMYRQGATQNISVGISGLTVTLSATNPALPMRIFVRDRWEVFPGQNDDTTGTGGTLSGNHSMHLSTTNTNIFLNWELRIRTGGLIGDDPALTDATSNEAVASAGELILHLSNVDTSGTPLGPNQLATNTHAISLFNFTNNTTLLTLVPQDNVITSADASTTTAGFVKTTTSNPIVVSTDDPRMGNSRPAADGSIHDSSVRSPVTTGGTNANATPQFKLPVNGGSDIGGISAAKIILLATTQALEDGWNWLVSSFNNLLAAFNAHYTAVLGQANTHPFPTAAQVGAAPLSHVGLPLGLPTSHPPVDNTSSGGFRVNRGVVGGGSPGDPAFGVFDSSNVNLASINHNGDVYSSIANGQVVSGVLSPAHTTGALGPMSVIASVLAEHVNQNSHNNPHGLTAADIGALTAAGYASSFTTNGYIKLPTALGALTIQWARGATMTGSQNSTVQSTNFPIAFPASCLFTTVSGSIASGSDFGEAPVFTVVAFSRTNVSYFYQRNADHGGLNLTPMIFAIGF